MLVDQRTSQPTSWRAFPFFTSKATLKNPVEKTQFEKIKVAFFFWKRFSSIELEQSMMLVMIEHKFEKRDRTRGKWWPCVVQNIFLVLYLSLNFNKRDIYLLKLTTYFLFVIFFNSFFRLFKYRDLTLNDYCMTNYQICYRRKRNWLMVLLGLVSFAQLKSKKKI